MHAKCDFPRGSKQKARALQKARVFDIILNVMTSRELRQKFLRFFEKKGHTIVPSSSLLPSDPSVLFTTAGMQQFKQYFLGEKSPYGSRVCSCQKCFRTSDIEAVGDASHLTFLEMLGNFSFGDYFKKEAIKFAYEFLFKELKLPQKKAIFTVFEGTKEVPADKDSALFLKKLGIPANKIKKCGRADNFWGPTGEEGPCGPTTEIHIKGIEVWNLVFNEYYQDRERKLAPLPQKGVDTGMGLERLAMVVQGKPSVFETDLFLPIISEISGQNEKAKRIIADHIKSAVFLISEGVFPSNVERGYVLRRILRRAISFGKLLNLPRNFLILSAQKTIEIYKNTYPEVKSQETDILTVIQNEGEKFDKVLVEGIREMEGVVIKLEKGGTHVVGAGDTLRIEQSLGVPFEIQKDFFAARGKKVQQAEHEMGREKHKEISRAGVEKKFGGVGKGVGYESAKLHTATHLLQAALREVLGQHIKQMGSDITPQRLRFDFSHHQKMTEKEIKKIEDLVNQKIKEDLEVKREEMSYEDALKSGALAFFKEKYPEKVSVYSIESFSKEICVGPHVCRTSELDHFKIVKEESSGANIRRIRAVLE